MTSDEAHDILQNIQPGDYHALDSGPLLAEADRVKYRKPRNANGSRGRYFHARVMRALNRG